MNLDAGAGPGDVISLGDSFTLRVDDETNGMSGMYYDGTDWVELASNQDIAGTGWHHIAYSFDAVNHEHTLYMDGVAIATANTAGTITYDQGVNTAIGVEGNGGAAYDFQGAIDDARIYTRVLSDSEITALANDLSLEDKDTVTITVNPVNDPPVANDDTLVINEGGTKLVTDYFTASHLIDNAANGAEDVVAIDLDQDGDLDVVSATSTSNTIAWYKNDGNENFTKNIISTTAQMASQIITADLDDDGDLDLLSSSVFDNSITWYENDGSENFTTHDITTTAIDANSVAVADVDGDGDKDILSASYGDDTLAWYENDGSENFTQNVINNSRNFVHVATTDMDGDGDSDLVAAVNTNGGVYWYENNGSGSFTEHVADTSTSEAGFVSTVDIDGDGDQDILVASESYVKFYWLENDGAQTFTSHDIAMADAACSIFAGDLDNDGDLDLATAAYNADTVAWYENDGIQNFSEHIITNTANTAKSVAIGDLDNDGDLEIFAAAANDNTITWYENKIGVLENDNDVEGDSLTVSLITDVSHGTLTLNADGRYSYIHDDSENFSDSFTYQIDDGNGGTDTATVYITINPVNDNAPLINDLTTSVAEDTANTTLVTNINDANTGNDTDTDSEALTYSITNGNGDNIFAIDSGTGEITIADNTNLDYETTSQYILTIQASDGTNSDTAAVTINVTDVNEFTVGAVTDNNRTANTVAEDAANGTVVGITTLATDADGTDTVTYSLSDDAGGLFALDANTGIVTVNGALDYESNTSHSVTVLATSTDGSSSNQAFTINITDVNEFAVGAVTDSNAAANTVAEDATSGTTVGITALATDADGTDTVTYSLSDDAGGLFAIDTNTGVVTVANPLDYETATSHSITVVATSSDSSTSNATFTINVTDVNEFTVSAVTDNNRTANTVAEDAANGTVVGITTLATDADGTDTVTYSLSDDAGGLFTIDANSGIVTVANALDYETATSHSITVVATSSDTSTSSQAVTINVTEINESLVIGDTDNGDDTELPNGNETDSTVDNVAATTDNSNGDSNDGTIIVVSHDGQEIPNSGNEDDKADDTSSVQVAVFESNTPEDQISADDETRNEDETIVTVNTGDSVEHVKISSQDDALIPAEQQPYLQVTSQTEKSDNNSRLLNPIHTNGAIRKVVKPAIQKTLDFIAPPAAAAPVYMDPSNPGGLGLKSTSMRTQLDAMHHDMDQAFEQSKDEHKIVIYMASGMSASFAVGAASYLLRAGSLMSSFLATVPLWKSFDPIAILAAPKKKQKKNEEAADESVPPSTTATDQNAESMFVGKENQ